MSRPKLHRRLPPTLAARVASKTAPHFTSEATSEVKSEVTSEARTPQVPDASNALIMRGDYWEARYCGRTVMLDDCRGLRYVALLLRDGRAGKSPLHAKELVALATGHAPDRTELERADEVLDGAARKAIVERLQEIAIERDRACAAENLARAAELDDEHERIADELSHAAARRRRRGAFNDASEKARKAVAKAISEAIAKAASYPDGSAIAEHFGTTIQKGQWLSYTGGVDWHVDFQIPLPRK